VYLGTRCAQTASDFYTLPRPSRGTLAYQESVCSSCRGCKCDAGVRRRQSWPHVMALQIPAPVPPAALTSRSYRLHATCTALLATTVPSAERPPWVRPSTHDGVTLALEGEESRYSGVQMLMLMFLGQRRCCVLREDAEHAHGQDKQGDRRQRQATPAIEACSGDVDALRWLRIHSGCAAAHAGDWLEELGHRRRHSGRWWTCHVS
jgi:hypothetical protein